MALQLSGFIGIVEGVQHVRKGEGIVFFVDITPVSSGTPDTITVTVSRQSDESDVTTTIMPTNSPTFSSGTVSLPEFVTDSNTANGMYVIDVELEISGEAWSPGKFPIEVRVWD